jgi:hypothetical protein
VAYHKARFVQDGCVPPSGPLIRSLNWNCITTHSEVSLLCSGHLFIEALFMTDKNPCQGPLTLLAALCHSVPLY